MNQNANAQLSAMVDEAMSKVGHLVPSMLHNMARRMVYDLLERAYNLGNADGKAGR